MQQIRMILLFVIGVMQIHAHQYEYCSQASQDAFVHTLLYKCLNKQDAGYYLEIGAGDPTHINNTYYFEKNYEWQGISIDISDVCKARWASLRKNRLVIDDALLIDYNEILKTFPKVIDYLSLDVDNLYDQVLLKIPFHNYTFKIITIEHDFYRFGDRFRKREREILSSLGYHLLCHDISLDGYLFEDWWIHPAFFPAEMLALLKVADLGEKDHNQLMSLLNAALLPVFFKE